MPKFTVPQPDGDIEISYYDSGLVKERKWTIADGEVEVEDDDREFFQNHVEGAELVETGDPAPQDQPEPGAAPDASESPQEETPRAPRKR